MVRRRMLNPRTSGRFRSARLFRPASLALLGPSTPTGTRVLANLSASGFAGRLDLADPTSDDIARLPSAPDVALIAVPATAELLSALGALGTVAAVAYDDSPGLLDHARAAGVRVLGPGSFGIAVPALRLDATTSHLPPRPGRLALVSQSASLCRAVIDWAEPSGIGFSVIAGMGGNADIGFGLVLDWLSRDAGTGAILLDIRGLHDRRAFLSAARAAARLRPVVALHSGSRLHDPTGRADAVLKAALTRAGVLKVDSFADLLGAAETLSAARPARSGRLAIVTNAIGPGQMAADATLSCGLALFEPGPGHRAALRLGPASPAEDGLVHMPPDQPTRLAETASMLSAVPEVGGVVVVIAPTGPADEAGIAALAAAQATMRLPLLVSVLGETTGALHRHRLADAGVPAFASPEQAVRAFLHLDRQRRARLSARELPDSAVLDAALDLPRIQAVITSAYAEGRAWLSETERDELLDAAQLRGEPAWRIRVADDPLFGPAIAFGDPELAWDVAFDLPPLNLALARAMAARTRRATPGAIAALVRVSQLFVDAPELGMLDLTSPSAIGLRPCGQTGKLAIAPYPAELVHEWQSRRERLLIRPIRPEDADAHRALFDRLSPEDVRYRFFSALRELSLEQVARMTDVDYDREMAFVAIAADGRTVGVCRLVREPYTTQAEFAIVVERAWKGHGLGRHLMERMLEWGRSRGVTHVSGQVLTDNAAMLAFVRGLGFKINHSSDEPEVIEAALALTPDDPGRVLTERSPASIRLRD